MERVSSLDFCSGCRTTDPADRLAPLDIAAEWDTRLKRFSAGLGVAGQQRDFYLKCTPSLWYHKVLKVAFRRFEVGDPSFDDHISTRTSKPEVAEGLLANEGVRSALLALLRDVRVNELAGNHVTLNGPSLLISTRPLGGLSVEKIQRLKIQATALALHLRDRART